MIGAADTGFLLQGLWWWLLVWPPVIWFVRRTYQITRPPIPGTGLLALQLLRSASITLLLLLLITPILQFVQRHARYPIVVTLIDDSRSMLVREDGVVRWQVVADSLAGGLGEALQRSVVGRFTDLAAASGDWESQGTQPPSGQTTDISSALQRGARWGADAGRLHAMVLLSDGRHNLGQDPVATAQALGVPVYTLGIGAAKPPDDVQITDLAAEPVLVAGHRSVLTVGLRQWGFEGRVVSIAITAQDDTIASSQHEFSQDGARMEARVHLPPLPAGPQTLQVTVTPEPGEITADNNVESVLVLVRPHRLRVLIIAGSPSADLAFLRRTLEADSSLACQFRSVRPSDSSPLPQDLTEFDVLVLHDLTREQLVPPATGRLAAYVQAGGGMLLVAGERLARAGGWPAMANLPLLMPRAALRMIDQPVQVATGAHQHPVVRSVAGPGDWSNLPPLAGVGSATTTPEGATILLQAGGQPVASAQALGQGRAITVVGSGFWRLDLLAQGAGESPHTVRRFWRQAVQWLGLPQATQRVRSIPRFPVVKHGQSPEVQVDVFDELMQPHADAQLTFTLNGEPQFPTIQRLGTGRYLAVWQGLAPGEYVYQLRASAEAEILGDDEGRFVVAEQSVETMDQRRDEMMLKRISQASGGDYRPLSDWPEMGERLSPPPALIREERQIGLEVRQYGWLVVLVCLLSAEWILRKRWGLL